MNTDKDLAGRFSSAILPLLESNHEATVVKTARVLAAFDAREAVDQVCAAASSFAEIGRTDATAELLEALTTFDDPKVLDYLLSMVHKHRNAELKAKALELLASSAFKAECEKIYEDLIRHPSWQIRAAIARGAAGLDPDTAEPFLVTLLEDENRNVVTAALIGLREKGTSYCLEYVEKVLANSYDTHIRAAALINLSRHAPQRAAAIVEPYLKDSDARVRASAIETLGKVAESNPGIINLLLPHLKDENNRCRANAIVALHHIAPEDSLEALRSLAASSKKWYRASAVYCASVLQKPEVLELLLPTISTEQDADVLARIEKTLEALEEPALVPQLMKLSAHPNPAIRMRALERILALHEDRARAAEFLLDAHAREQIPEVKGRLLELLGTTDHPAVTDLAREALESSDERLICSALKAIGCMKQHQLQAMVQPFTDSPHPAIRAEAAAASIRLGKTDEGCSVLESMLSHTDRRHVNVALDKVLELAAERKEPAETHAQRSEEALSVGEESSAAIASPDSLEDLPSVRLPESPSEAAREGLEVVEPEGGGLEEVELTTGELRIAPGEDEPASPRPDEDESEEAIPTASELLLIEESPDGEFLETLCSPPYTLEKWVEACEQRPHNHLIRFCKWKTFNFTEELPDEETIRDFRAREFTAALVITSNLAKERKDRGALLRSFAGAAATHIKLCSELLELLEEETARSDESRALDIVELLAGLLNLRADIHKRAGDLFLRRKAYSKAYEQLLMAAAASGGEDEEVLLKLCGAAIRTERHDLAERIALHLIDRSESAKVKEKAGGLLEIARKGAETKGSTG